MLVLDIRVEIVPLSTGGTEAARRIFEQWSSRPHTFWLDSASDPGRLGRFSFLGTDPYEVVQWTDGGWEELADLADPIFRKTTPPSYPAPFAGGLVGYIGYDAGLASVGRIPRAGVNSPLSTGSFGAYDAIVCVDHAFDRLYIVSTGLPFLGGGAEHKAKARLAWLRQEVEAALQGSASEGTVPRAKPSPSVPRSTFTRGKYARYVERVLAMIEAGEVEQVNLSQRFTVPTHMSGPELYVRLREANPAPFGAALHVEGGWILSSSPERFLRIEGDRIEMRPIKGTRPRGQDPATDEANRTALLTSAKDARELHMIEELTRQELARVCVPGSVSVPEAKVCEAYETVFHLVSTVAGRLKPGANPIGCVQQLFPAGSITGRPKSRAMEIIDDLEPVPRGVYTGAIGYFGVGGNVDLNVAIRTMVWQAGRVDFHVGGAVVAGSSPEDEYDETLAKAEGMMRALFSRSR